MDNNSPHGAGFPEWHYEAIIDLADRWQIDEHEAEAALEDMGVF